MKRNAIILLIVAMFVLLDLVTTSENAISGVKPIELSYSSFFPAEYGMGKAATAWAREIEKRTNGKVKITVYHGGTLTSAVDCYEGVVMGTSDIGQSCLAYTRGRFPLMEVTDLPGYPFNAIVTSRVAYEIYKKFKPRELMDTHVLYLHAHIPGVIFTRDKPVRRLEDLKGLRIRCTGLSAKIIEALGGVPVAMPKGDQYDAMLKGVVDGTTGSPNELKGWRVAEVAKFSTVYPKVGYVTAMFVTMNRKTWESLPPEVQKVFTEVSEEWVIYSGQTWNNIEIEGIRYGRQKGHQFIFLSPDEGARWGKAVKPLFDEYIKNTTAKGLPGREALEYRQYLIKKYSRMYAPLKFE